MLFPVSARQDKYIDHVWLKDGHLIVLTAEKLFVFHRSPDTGTPVAQLPITGDFLRAETVVACNKGRANWDRANWDRTNWDNNSETNWRKLWGRVYAWRGSGLRVMANCEADIAAVVR